ncbi:transcription termination factor MTERF5, chloroplastic-like protein [Tanacetum coccineum]|uniref:Transcription termination factor MTERF5, chloroplastic-like protein n=1 Tax=Tanacetum coccineum TaxID=301880 RepID=A0ABQ5BZP6_9ASTR
MFIQTLKSLHKHFSTQTNPDCITNYLITSLNLTKNEALTLSAKIPHLKTPEKPNSVITFLTQCGLTKPQIKTILTNSPTLLTTDINKTLKPKFHLFQELGFKVSTLEKLFKPSINISSTRLDNNLRYLRVLLGFDDAKVFKVVSRSWWKLASDYEKKISENILVLRKYGLSSHKIESLLLRNPGCLLRHAEWLDGVVKKVEPLLGIRSDSPRFFDGVEIVMSFSEATLNKKLGIFRSFGWTEDEIVRMTGSLPSCLRRSEGTIKASLEWFKENPGYGGAYLSTHPKLLVYSLEKRVVPRYQVWVTLWVKGLLKNRWFSLCSLVALSEEKFVRDFVLPYCEVVPSLHEDYTNSTCLKINYYERAGRTIVNRSLMIALQTLWRLKLRVSKQRIFAKDKAFWDIDCVIPMAISDMSEEDEIIFKRRQLPSKEAASSRVRSWIVSDDDDEFITLQQSDSFLEEEGVFEAEVVDNGGEIEMQNQMNIFSSEDEEEFDTDSEVSDCLLNKYRTKFDDEVEETLKEHLPKLHHIKELRYGISCSRVISRLQAKGFSCPSNLNEEDEDVISRRRYLPKKLFHLCDGDCCQIYGGEIEVQNQKTNFSSQDEEDFDNEAAIVHVVLTDSEFDDELEETLKEHLLKLHHVKELRYGISCSWVISRLQAKGFTCPSNLKYADSEYTD